VSSFLQITYKWARRCAIALVGGTVVLIGILMIVFPGPAIVVIPAGLAILSLEFAWAKHWLRKVKATGNSVMNSASAYWSRDKGGSPPEQK
jgi:tellurite resistance protein TerC